MLEMVHECECETRFEHKDRREAQRVVRKCEEQSGSGLLAEYDFARFLTFVFERESKALTVLLNEHLLGFDLHVGGGVFLDLNVGVDCAGPVKQV